MILDERLEFADAEDVSATTGTANTANQIDLSVARDIGNGQPVYLYVIVDVAFATATTAEVAFQLASDATASVDTGGAQTIHYTSRAFDTGELTAGTVAVFVEVPQEAIDTYEQFLALQVVTTSATTTAGSITAGLTLDKHGWKAYADAVN